MVSTAPWMPNWPDQAIRASDSATGGIWDSDALSTPCRRSFDAGRRARLDLLPGIVARAMMPARAVLSRRVARRSSGDELGQVIAHAHDLSSRRTEPDLSFPPRVLSALSSAPDFRLPACAAAGVVGGAVSPPVRLLAGLPRRLRVGFRHARRALRFSAGRFVIGLGFLAGWHRRHRVLRAGGFPSDQRSMRRGSFRPRHADHHRLACRDPRGPVRPMRWT